MELQLQEISAKQKASWNKFSPGWKKWDEEFMDFLVPMRDEIIDALQLKGTELVLDIAAGTGEPGLTIAKQLPGGRVVLTDLSDGMLTVAREHALIRGITNVEFQACDVSSLPFADNTFDAISCRLGFMFFPDMELAAKEMFRVLKPGGRIATSVWGEAERNFWVTVMGGTINRNLHLTPPAPGAPGMFRCAKQGLIAGLFQQAGFTHTTEKEVSGELDCGSAEVFWNMMTDIAAPFVAALSKADEAMQSKIKAEVIRLINQQYPEDQVVMEGIARVIAGQK